MSDHIDETATDAPLIAASLVSGTAVYDPNGEKIGRIEDVMIDKLSGQARYAILSFGGFLGIGDQHHRLPCATLKYEPAFGGYVANLDLQQIKDTSEIWPAAQTAGFSPG